MLQSTHYQHVQQLGEHDEELDGLSEQVDEKDVVVSDANAVVYPGAVVIISLDASSTYDAVSAPARSNDLTLRAQTLCIERFQETEKLNALVGDVARIFAAKDNV